VDGGVGVGKTGLVGEATLVGVVPEDTVRATSSTKKSLGRRLSVVPWKKIWTVWPA
jgi:hypothetical protein